MGFHINQSIQIHYGWFTCPTHDTLQPSTYNTVATHTERTLWDETLVSLFHRWRCWCSQQHLSFKHRLRQTVPHSTTCEAPDITGAILNLWLYMLLQHHRANLRQRTQLFRISPTHEEKKDDHVLNHRCSSCTLFGSHGLRFWRLCCLLSRKYTNNFRIYENSDRICQPGSKQFLQVHSFLKIKYFQGALKNISHSIKDNRFLNILLFSPIRHDTERGYKVLLLSNCGRNVPGKGSLQTGLLVRLLSLFLTLPINSCIAWANITESCAALCSAIPQIQQYPPASKEPKGFCGPDCSHCWFIFLTIPLYLVVFLLFHSI